MVAGFAMNKATRTFAALQGCLLASVATAAGQEEAPAVPSGLSIQLQEYFVEPQPDGALWARFRFVAPALAEGVSFAKVEQDFPSLCSQVALPRLSQTGQAVDQVVISLASQPVAFGVADADIIQFFEAYRIENGLCIWEGF